MRASRGPQGRSKGAFALIWFGRLFDGYHPGLFGPQFVHPMPLPDNPWIHCLIYPVPGVEMDAFGELVKYDMPSLVNFGQHIRQILIDLKQNNLGKYDQATYGSFVYWYRVMPSAVMNMIQKLEDKISRITSVNSNLSNNGNQIDHLSHSVSATFSNSYGGSYNTRSRGRGVKEDRENRTAQPNSGAPTGTTPQPNSGAPTGTTTQPNSGAPTGTTPQPNSGATKKAPHKKKGPAPQIPTAQPKPAAPEGTTAQPKPAAPEGTTAQPKPAAPTETTAQPKPEASKKAPHKKKGPAPQVPTAQPKPAAPEGTTAQPETPAPTKTTRKREPGVLPDLTEVRIKKKGADPEEPPPKPARGAPPVSAIQRIKNLIFEHIDKRSQLQEKELRDLRKNLKGIATTQAVNNRYQILKAIEGKEYEDHPLYKLWLYLESIDILKQMKVTAGFGPEYDSSLKQRLRQIWYSECVFRDKYLAQIEQEGVRHMESDEFYKPLLEYLTINKNRFETVIWAAEEKQPYKLLERLLKMHYPSMSLYEMDYNRLKKSNIEGVPTDYESPDVRYVGAHVENFRLLNLEIFAFRHYVDAGSNERDLEKMADAYFASMGRPDLKEKPNSTEESDSEVTEEDLKFRKALREHVIEQFEMILAAMDSHSTAP